MSSNDFIPVISPNGIDFTSGEWISDKEIIPLQIKQGTKEEVIARTEAGIYIINDKYRYLSERRKPEIWQQLKNKQAAYSIVENMVTSNILTCIKSPSKKNLNKNYIHLYTVLKQKEER